MVNFKLGNTGRLTKKKSESPRVVDIVVAEVAGSNTPSCLE